MRVAGTDRAISFADLAAHPAATPEKLTAANDFGTDAPTYPNGTHIAEVEIDPDTGATSIINYVIVDDFGATLNPLLLEGQVHGGTVQGIGQALMEDTVYDAASGQLVSAPRSWTTPCRARTTRRISCSRRATCRARPTRSASKAQARRARSVPVPAVINAVIDALDRAYGIRAIDMPATPLKIWTAIQARQPGGGGIKVSCVMFASCRRQTA